MMAISNTRKDKLRDRINCNKYLLHTIAKRGLCDPRALEINELTLEQARSQLYIDMRKYMPFTNTKLFDNADEAILDADEKQAMNAKNICTYYDPAAFVDTMVEAVNTYRPNESQFTSWFSRLYSQRASARVSDEIYNHQISQKAIVTLKKIDNYLRSIDKSPGDLDEIAIEALAIKFGWSKKQLKSAWRIREQQQMLSIETPISDTDDALTLSDTIVDLKSLNDFMTAEHLIELHRLLAVIYTPDTKEYSKLFWSNLFLHPFKDELDGKEAKYAISPANYLELYKQLEVELFNFFVQPYLHYCLDTPPEPDSIDHINECKSLHPFISKTIAAYKNVSAAYVSQQEKKFRRLQAEFRKMYA